MTVQPLTAAPHDSCDPTLPGPVALTPDPDQAPQVAALVALHIASCADAETDLKQRDAIRTAYESFLRITLLADTPDFAIAHIPGASFNDPAVWAVHLPSGTVFDDTSETRGRVRAVSTTEWVANLRGLLP